ncbi:MAG: VPLPA-CTERM sorting domain-containing protein [Candidatus Thiodiazotropha sp. (ex Codakia rugifera)]|nr:VPLPA-CTERM sorting domain-containing protein [Candidatus Thiodiazotropha sp. (ex Codakia rugifera)]
MLNHILKIIAISTIVIFSKQATAALASTGSVYLNAEPGSWVGGGIGASEVTWTHGIEGLFSITGNFDQGASVTFDDGNYWRFDFAAPTYDPISNTNTGNRLETGFYNNATRYPFNSPTRPGLDFSGNGRGNNTLGGWFDVLAIEYGTGNDVLGLAIDFRQFDESEDMLGASTFGSLRINSNLALNLTGEPLSQVPVPAAIWLFGTGLIALIGISRKKRSI